MLYKVKIGMYCDNKSVNMHVLKIFICPDKGQPMQEIEHVLAIKDKGLEGDRYANGTGAYSKDKRVTVRHVSLFSIEAFNAANSELTTPFTLAETRRNILTEGVDLNSLVGKEFMVGGILMLGIELCDPCNRPNTLAEKKDFDIAFKLRGGLRAQIISSGIISVGDEIKIS